LCDRRLAHPWTRHSNLTFFNRSRFDDHLILIAGKEFFKNIINIAIIVNAPRITTHLPPTINSPKSRLHATQEQSRIFTSHHPFVQISTAPNAWKDTEVLAHF
jgi:hypothetical protein